MAGPTPAHNGVINRLKHAIKLPIKSNFLDSEGEDDGALSTKYVDGKLRLSSQHHVHPAVHDDTSGSATSSDSRARSLESALVDSRNSSIDSSLRSSLSLSSRDSDVSNELYGKLPEGEPRDLIKIAELDGLSEGTEVAFRARIHTQRDVSAALDFVLLRDQTTTVQAVLEHLPVEMIKWTQRLRHECLVQITGTVKTPKAPVRSATLRDVEVLVKTLHLVSPAGVLPFDNYKAPTALRRRLENRVLDLRHPTNQAIFRVRGMVTRKFREALDDQGFVEIQTPKLQPAATESGAQVFKVNYFGRKAFLAQSPQLAKQMSIAADLGRVYEIGPVFRAENSNTHRHLTEYTGLDIEMSLVKSYDELVVTVDRTLKNIFAAVQAMPELKIIRERFPCDDLVWIEETPRIPFVEGVRMLREDGQELEDEDDLSTAQEIRLGQLVKKKFGTDYFILDKFPAGVRPFYARRVEGRWTNSFDIILRGQEICTGGERIHNAAELRESMCNNGISVDGMEEYLSAFDLGAPPHGGAGLGLERIVMLMLNLGDVRNATLFHRDPKSLPARPPRLPHPEADTTQHRDGADLPGLEDLIANYGDATNTSWLDSRFEIWRHRNGAAVGYVRQSEKLVVVAGNPLCDESQYEEVAKAFLDFVQTELKLTPVWLLVSETVQEILGRKRGWRSLTCTEEQRVLTEKRKGPSVQKQRRVQREGIKIGEAHPDEDFRRRADAAIDNWKKNRKGKQVHLTEIRPWVDERHRRYFSAEKDGRLLAMVVLHQLSPRHGWQVKWALDFPHSTNGAIEVLVESALSTVEGNVTFGAGVSAKLTPGMNLNGAKAKFLAKTYTSLVETLGLARKADFRQKFGATGEPLYICYPRHGMGVMELKQIIKFFED